MSLTKLAKDLSIISKLSDEPNDTDGLTADELKAKFDESGNSIKDYLNNTMTPELDTAIEELGEATAESYKKPDSGIPKTDLASDVQTSLGKADTALQSGALPAGGADGDVLVKDGATDYSGKWTSTPPQMGSLATIETSPTSQAHEQFENIVYNGKLYQVVIAVGPNESLVPGTNIVERKALPTIFTFTGGPVEVTPGVITTVIPSTPLPKGRYLLIADVTPNKSAKTTLQCRFFTDTGSYIRNDPVMSSSIAVQSIALATFSFSLSTYIGDIQFDGTTPYTTKTNVTGRVIAIKL